VIAELQPYPAYEDSGVPWLGTIPAGWEMRRNGRLFAQRNQTGFARLPILEVSLKTGVRVRDFDSATRKQVLSDKDKYKRACCGDVAYNMMRLWQGAVGVAPVDGLVSPAYVVARPLAETNARYFEYVFRTDSYKSEINKFSRGIVSDRNRLYWEDFKQMPSPVPPLEVQAAIVRFLDHADRRIRRYIRGKQKLIAVLNEQKQAIIHSAVTRGLDPNVRLKPSGVEWLGDVPEHWRAVRLKQVAAVQTGITLGKNYGVRPLVARPYLRVANVQTGRLSLDRITTTRVPVREAEGSTLQPGDVLMTEGGDIDKLGRGCVWRGEIPECLHQNHIFAVRPNQGVLLPEFLVGLMASRHGRTFFEITAKKTTNLAATNSTTLRCFPLWLPEVEEQEHILRWTRERVASLDSTATRAESEASLMREYRTRLIADVVTGKLDVREVAAELPAEADEPESLDTVEVSDDVSEDAGDGDNADLEQVDETAQA